MAGLTRNLRQFYIYVHYRASDLTPFYIGKGSGSRLHHESKRTDFWKSTADKHGVVKKKLVSSLTEEEAFKLEARLIALYRGRGHKLVNFTDGGEGVSGFKHSNETKLKISKAQKGKKRAASPGRGKAISNAKLNKKTKVTKAVYCITDKTKYPSIGSAARAYNINAANLSKLLHKKGSHKTLAGREFKWLD